MSDFPRESAPASDRKLATLCLYPATLIASHLLTAGLALWIFEAVLFEFPARNMSACRTKLHRASFVHALFGLPRCELPRCASSVEQTHVPYREPMSRFDETTTLTLWANSDK